MKSRTESVEKMDGKGTENEDTCTFMEVAEKKIEKERRAVLEVLVIMCNT